MEILQSIIASYRVGDKLKLEVWRDGEILSVLVELGRSSTME
jgi:S1-C subfamily serine protease